MTMTLAERRPTSGKGPLAGGGWFISTRYRDEVVWKEGGTGGYSSYVGFSTRTRRGCILLSNAADWTANLMTGMHLVNAAYPLPKVHRQVAVDSQLLATYAGRYELTPAFALTVRASGAHLYVQATGQAEYEVFAENDRDFFYRIVDAQITFDPPEDGKVRSLTLHQNGQDRPGRRVTRSD